MVLMSKPTHDPKLTRWWWRTLREWIYELIDPLWGAFRGENSDEITLANLTDINGVSASELAILDGLTATNAELNKLSGLTADAAELNKADRTTGDGTAEASKNVVLDANKDVLGKRYDINQSLLEALAGGSRLRFDGTNDNIAPDNSTEFVTGTGPFSFFLLVRPQFPSSNYTYLIAIGNGATGEQAGLRVGSDGKLSLSAYTSPVVETIGAITEDVWQAIAFTYNGITAKFYVNGTLLDTKTISLNTTTGKMRIGCHVSDGSFYKGLIRSVRYFNRVLTSEEIQDLASGASVECADMGAGQTERVTNGEDWTGASGSTPPNSWSDSGSGTAIYIIRDNTPVENFGDNKALEFSASGESKTLYQGVAQAGKRFRVSFVYRNLDGSSSSYVALGSSTNKATLQNTGIPGDGILFKQDFMADGTDLMFFVDTGGTLQIDHVQVIQIGCVAAYQPAGITHAQWQDDSGNELHGSISGAVPLNLPSNHVARYIKQGITGDTTLTDAVPAGYRIKSMVADVTGAGVGMRLNVGTGAGGTDVVNNQDISSNGLFDLTVGKHIFNLSSAQSLYVNDDGGTTWSGVSVDLYIEMGRVK